VLVKINMHTFSVGLTGFAGFGVTGML